jgi:hypothetical protein
VKNRQRDRKTERQRQRVSVCERESESERNVWYTILLHTYIHTVPKSPTAILSKILSSMPRICQIMCVCVRER